MLNEENSTKFMELIKSGLRITMTYFGKGISSACSEKFVVEICDENGTNISDDLGITLDEAFEKAYSKTSHSWYKEYRKFFKGESNV